MASDCDGTCPVNSGSAEGSDELTDCLADAGFTGVVGSWWQSGGVAACASGTFKAAAASSAACTACPSNSGTGVDTGSSAESYCLADAGFTGAGSTVSECAIDTFKAVAASSDACDSCPSSSTTGSSMGSDELTDCLADAGFTGTGGSVAACSAHTFKATPASALACTACPSHSGTGSATGSDAVGDCLADAGFTGAGGGSLGVLGGHVQDFLSVICGVHLVCCLQVQGSKRSNGRHLRGLSTEQWQCGGLGRADRLSCQRRVHWGCWQCGCVCSRLVQSHCSIVSNLHIMLHFSEHRQLAGSKRLLLHRRILEHKR